MDVTLSNFKEKLPIINEAISTSSFISIDTELTGLNQEWNLNAYDSPTERYIKIRQNAEDFLVIQFGLCAFHYQPDSDKYTYQAFNFYIFPRSYKKLVPDIRFYCQSSSLEFLLSHGFNFNKLISEGISYIRSADEDKLRESVSERQEKMLEELQSNINKNMTNGTEAVIPDEHKDFINSVHAQVEQFLSKEEKSVRLSPCNAYRRKLIYDSVKPKYSDLEFETVRLDDGQAYIQVNRTNKEEIMTKFQTKKEQENEELEMAIGFTKVIQMITESGKLVVGHNMFLDVLHTLHKFCCRLPEDYDELKQVLQSAFPRLLDTKVMSSTSPFKELFQSNSLNEVLKRTKEKPFPVITVEACDKDHGYNSESEKLHEAGYDAYITGTCFISLSSYLKSLQKKKKQSKVDCGSSHLIRPFVNKVFMMKSADIPYMNLSGDDLKPNRDHVFHIQFPAEWKLQDIYNLFSTNGGPVSVAWINDTSAYVALKYPEKLLIAKALLGDHDEEYKLTTFLDFKNEQPQTSPGATPAKRKKTLESEPAALITPIFEEKTQDAPRTKKMKTSDEKKKTSDEKKIFEELDNWS